MLDICFVTSELAPLAKVGGLADVSAALPAALNRAGQNVTVVLPFYRDLKLAGNHEVAPLSSLTDVELDFGERQLTFNGYQAVYPQTTNGEGPLLVLIECNELFDRPGIYGESEDESLRFLLLSRAAIEACQRLRIQPDIIHCNDWQTALIPLLLRTTYSWDRLFENTSTVLTIHNIGHQGAFPASLLPQLQLGDQQFLLHQDDLHAGVINYLKTGILYADALTAVSPTYARQIQTDEYGAGLHELLARKSEEKGLVGILNGIDRDEWNPAIDSLIPHQYSAADLSGKQKNKQALQEKMGVEVNPNAPTIGIVSRLTSQKGFELLHDSMESILSQRDLQLLVLGSGEQKYVDYFTQLRRQFPEKVGFFHGFDNELAHWIEAGSDLFLMPSRYEPCGLNQMYSQVYGTIPIVRNTGGLADTVEHYLPSSGSGTGFVFEHFTSAGLQWAVNCALDVFADKSAWQRLIQNAMALDYSWDTQASQYIQLYRHLSSRFSPV